jgi:hypothetical protein
MAAAGLGMESSMLGYSRCSCNPIAIVERSETLPDPFDSTVSSIKNEIFSKPKLNKPNPKNNFAFCLGLFRVHRNRAPWENILVLLQFCSIPILAISVF